MRLALIGAPVVALYSPTLLVTKMVFVTKRRRAEVFNTSPKKGACSPVMKLALIAAPVVALYLPTLLAVSIATKRSVPDTDSPVGPFRRVMKGALISAPVVALYLL